MSTARPLRFKDFVFQGKNYTAEAVEVAAEAADAMETAIDGFVDSLVAELTKTNTAKIADLIKTQEEGIKALEAADAANSGLEKALQDLIAKPSFTALDLADLLAKTQAANQAVKDNIEKSKNGGKAFAEAAGKLLLKTATGGIA